MSTLAAWEQQQVDKVNDSGRQPVMFVHGLWLLASSWDLWRGFVEGQGYLTLAPGWPDDPDTVAEAKRNPQIFAHKHVQQIVDHFAEAARQLKTKPALIGHSFGGLMVQKLAGQELGAVTVAIDPAPFRGVLPL